MPTIGEQLKQARSARKLTHKQVMQATRIRDYYLAAMEADDFSSLPSPAQARGFLRSYAEYLGLEADELINRQRNGTVPLEFTPPAQPGKDAPQPPVSEAVETSPESPSPEPAPAPVAEVPAATHVQAAPGSAPKVEKEAPPAPSQLIFREIGSQLRQRRELLSLTYEEIERHTHVRKHYLETIETGDFDELPSPVQARGMLSTYASFLDMDAEALLLRFADALQARRMERHAAAPQKSSLPRRRALLPVWLRRFISPDLLFGGAMIFLLLALTLWGAVRILGGNEAAGAKSPSISDVLLASPQATDQSGTVEATTVAEIGTPLPELAVDEITATDTPVFSEGAASAVQITVSVLERTFLRVVVDGEIQQEGRVAPGAALVFDGNQRIEILTGNGAAVQVLFNREDQGLMGNFGEVVNRIYTINGVETPTPTASPTASITPKPSLTPRPTLTLRPSSTPRPTVTPLASPTENP
jgi:cytoskeleton protein RodZ